MNEKDRNNLTGPRGWKADGYAASYLTYDISFKKMMVKKVELISG